MTRAQVRLILALILVLGTVTRVMAWKWGNSLYPDAHYQYLEPAWSRISGFGMDTWEWRDGIRSWVLPGYHGAWIALFARLGMRGSSIASGIRLHWGLLSLLLVWGAWRAGTCFGRQFLAGFRQRALSSCGNHYYDLYASDAAVSRAPDGWQAGLLAAYFVATSPLLCVYSVNSLTELPSTIGLVWGFALTAEMVELESRASKVRAIQIGLITSAAICLRVVNAGAALLLPIWLLISGPRRMLLPMSLAALVPVAVFGLVDRLTWGGFFSSFFAYLKFNVAEGRAADFGTEPARWYLDQLKNRAPIGIWLLLVPALFAIRVSWPLMVTAGGVLALVSSQAHKEERFMLVFWPLLMIAPAVGASPWLRLQHERVNWGEHLTPVRLRMSSVMRIVAVVCASLWVSVEGLRHLENREHSMLQGRFDCQAWLGRRPNVSGVLLDWNFYFGGYMWLDRPVPQLQFESALLPNHIFSHVIVPRGSSPEREALRSGFSRAYSQDSIVVLERQSTP